jgi:hypothetical protein
MNSSNLPEPQERALVAGRIDTGRYRDLSPRAVNLPGMRLGTHIVLQAECTYELKRNLDNTWVMASHRVGEYWLYDQGTFESWSDVQTFIKLMRIVDLEYLGF